MSLQRCPDCQALNAEDARRCSLCGRSLAAESQVPAPADTEPAVVPAEAADAAPQPEPGPPTPEASHYAHAAGPRRGTRAVVGAAMGAGVAAVLVVLTYVVLSGLRSLPLVGYGASQLQPLAVFGANLPPVIPALPVAVVLGGIVGAFTTARNSPWAGAVLFAALAVALRVISLLVTGLGLEGGWFVAIYGTALALVDAAFGAVYGYAVSLFICGRLAATRTRPTD